MAVLTLSNAHLAYGHVALLDGAAFSLEAGERVGLIGRNGTGKSSLLKVISPAWRARRRPAADDAGPAHPLRAAGAAVRRRCDGVRRVARGRRRGARAARRYEAHAAATTSTRCRRASRRSTPGTGSSASRRLHALAPRPRARRSPLSGGTQERVALARRWSPSARRAAARRADQPPRPRRDRLARGAAQATSRGALVCHARPRLPRCRRHPHRRARPRRCAAIPATSPPTSARRQSELAAEALASARADKLLAQEEVWIRKGVEARRTRSEGACAPGAAARAARRAARVARPVRLELTRRAERQDRRRAEHVSASASATSVVDARPSARRCCAATRSA